MQYRRTPKGYSGTKPTTHRLRDVLQEWIHSFETLQDQNHLVLWQVWEVVVGADIFPHTKFAGYKDHALYIFVDHPTLYHHLSREKKQHILNEMKRQLPEHDLRDIKMRMG